MIGILDVLEWLNFNDQSYLLEEDKFSFRQINDPKIPQSQKDGALIILNANAVNSLNNLEKAELKVCLGVYYFRNRKYEEAIVHLNECEKLYEKKSHRQGVTNWMRGMVFWKTHENIKAFANWRVALNIFETLRDQNSIAKLPSKVNWYDKAIDEMKVEITQTAEEAFDWLNKWDQSSLDDRALMFVKEIEERIKANEFSSAYEIGMGLGRISRLRMNPQESAEASVVIGLEYHRMGQPKLAIDYFLRAGATFTPGQYHQAVTKWMLGVAQWELRTEWDNAFRSWREAIDLFYEVMAQTDRGNDQKKRLWIENQLKFMQKSLDIKTKEILRN
jgi:tetratricopeptide (TPR) repeat protein